MGRRRWKPRRRHPRLKVPTDGGAPIELANTLSINPVWSPDGGLILYSEQQRAGQLEVKAITPDRTPIAIVTLQVVGFSAETRYRFVPAGDALIVLEGVIGASQNFYKVDLATGERRQLTDLDGTYVIGTSTCHRTARTSCSIAGGSTRYRDDDAGAIGPIGFASSQPTRQAL